MCNGRGERCEPQSPAYLNKTIEDCKKCDHKGYKCTWTQAKKEAASTKQRFDNAKGHTRSAGNFGEGETGDDQTSVRSLGPISCAQDDSSVAPENSASLPPSLQSGLSGGTFF